MGNPIPQDKPRMRYAIKVKCLSVLSCEVLVYKARNVAAQKPGETVRQNIKGIFFQAFKGPEQPDSGIKSLNQH